MQQAELDLGDQQTDPEILENDSKPLLMERMAQAILSIIQHQQGEHNET